MPTSDIQLSTARSRFLHLVSGLIDEREASQLFDLFNIIAMLPYEEIENTGTLALCSPDAPLPAMLVRFETPFQMRDVRGIRKCLHITDENLCVVSDCRSAFGFTTTVQLSGDVLVVEFRRAGIWELCGSGEIALRVEAPARLADRAFDRHGFEHELRSTFPQLSIQHIDQLCHLADAAARQGQGTNVLISGDAGAEARRLSPQCTLVKPVPFVPALMERCTSIDGTVIIDTNGNCYAIGAILDGDVSRHGDRTRGGRYNSALMYIDSTAIPSLIIVVSRDGTVDFVSSTGKHRRA